MEHKKIIGVGFVMMFVLICGYVSISSNEEYRRKGGITLEAREGLLHQEGYGDAEILSEIFFNKDNSCAAAFSMYECKESGIAFFEKQKNGSYHLKSVMKAPSGCIVSDNIRYSNVNYVVFYLEQPNLSNAEVSFVSDDKSWVNTYETEGFLLIEQPAELEFKCKATYYDVNGNRYE